MSSAWLWQENDPAAAAAWRPVKRLRSKTPGPLLPMNQLAVILQKARAWRRVGKAEVNMEVVVEEKEEDEEEVEEKEEEEKKEKEKNNSDKI